MINVKVIEVKKYYMAICLLITLLMVLLSFKILIFEGMEEFVVKANGSMGNGKIETIQEQDSVKSKLFILILNKSIPVLEIANKDSYGDNTYTHLIRLALEKLINFDYRDPKTFFRAQIPVFQEANKEIAFEEESEENIVPEAIDIQAPASNIPAVQEINKPEFDDTKPILNSGNALETDSAAPANSVSSQPAENSNSNAVTLGSVEIVSSSAQMPNKLKLDLKKPSILVYHTHGTESYLPAEEGNFHSLENRKYTVRAVGDKLTSYLKEKKYQVIHDDTIHDYPSYNESYVRSLETLKNNLSENKSLKIVFDIHRDAIAGQNQSVVKINNEKAAICKLIIGGKSDNVEKLRVFAKYFKAKSDEMYPGLISVIIEKDYAKFNQYESDYYALIEVGNITNHIDEAINSTKYLTEVIDAVIKDIKE